MENHLKAHGPSNIVMQQSKAKQGRAGMVIYLANIEPKPLFDPDI